MGRVREATVAAPGKAAMAAERNQNRERATAVIVGGLLSPGWRRTYSRWPRNPKHPPVIVDNKKAAYNYFFEERYEA